MKYLILIFMLLLNEVSAVHRTVTIDEILDGFSLVQRYGSIGVDKRSTIDRVVLRYDFKNGKKIEVINKGKVIQRLEISEVKLFEYLPNGSFDTIWIEDFGSVVRVHLFFKSEDLRFCDGYKLLEL